MVKTLDNQNPPEIRSGYWRLRAATPASVAPSSWGRVSTGCFSDRPVLLVGGPPKAKEAPYLVLPQVWDGPGEIFVTVFNLAPREQSHFDVMFQSGTVRFQVGDDVACAVEIP